MSHKVIGTILIVAGFGGFGFLVAGSVRNNTKILQQLIRALNTMDCELQYRKPPLPDLCRETADVCTGKLRFLFIRLAEKLDNRTAESASVCMKHALSEMQGFSKNIEQALVVLGDSLGNFDVAGQLKGLAYTRSVCEDMLKDSMINQDIKLRSYQTLAICAGAALAILFV